MTIKGVFEGQLWEEFKGKVKKQLKKDIKEKGLDKALEKHFYAFCLTFQEPIAEVFEEYALSDENQEQLLTELMTDFFKEVMEDPTKN